MASVFISYSRQDRDFVLRLQRWLMDSGREVWVDLKDIPPTAEWQREIDAGIAAAETFIAVLSPDYIASAACAAELERAGEFKKRMVPLVRGEVHAAEAPPALSALNWIFCRPSDDFAAAMEQLRFALDTDLAYWHEAADILVRAQRWDDKRRNDSFTLRGSELTEAERWLNEGVDKQPSPTALQVKFITASRRGAASRQRRLIGALSIGLIITILLSIVAVSQTLVAQARTTEAQNRAHDLLTRTLAGKANGLLLTNHLDQALLLSVLATQRKDVSGLGTSDANDALLNALEYSPHVQAVLEGPPTVPVTDIQYPNGTAVAFSADGHTLLSARGNGDVRLWDGTTERPLKQLGVGTNVLTAALSPDGSTVATQDYSTHGDSVRLWNTSTGQDLGVHLGVTDTSSAAHAVNNEASTGLLFSPDDRTLAVAECADAACAHGQVAFFDLRAGTLLGAVPLVYPPYHASLAFSPNGQMLAVAECDRNCYLSNLTVWSVSARAQLWADAYLPDGDGVVRAVAFSPDGKTLATGECRDIACSVGQVRLWDTAAGVAESAKMVDLHGGITAIAFSPDGQTLLTGGSQGVLQLWNVTSGLAIGAPLTGDSDLIAAVAFNPDGRHFASASADTHIILWRTTPSSSFSLPLGPDLDGASQVVFSPDGKEMATGNCDGKLRLWDVATGKRTALLADPSVPATCIFSLAFSPDGTLLAAGSADGYGQIWDLATQQMQIGCRCELGHIGVIAISRDNHYLVTTNDNQGDVTLWDLTTQQKAYEFTGPVTAIQRGAAFSPDGHILVVSEATGAVIVWNVDQGQQELELPASSRLAAAAVAFSPDGRTLAVLAADGEITLWSAHAWKQMGRFLSPQSQITYPVGLSFGADNQTLVVTQGQTIALWNTATRQLIAHPLVETNRVFNAVISPDGRLLASSEGPVIVRYASVALWQAEACRIANRNLSKGEWASLVGSDPPYQTICPGLPAPTS